MQMMRCRNIIAAPSANPCSPRQVGAALSTFRKVHDRLFSSFFFLFSFIYYLLTFNSYLLSPSKLWCYGYIEGGVRKGHPRKTTHRVPAGLLVRWMRHGLDFLHQFSFHQHA